MLTVMCFLLFFYVPDLHWMGILKWLLLIICSILTRWWGKKPELSSIPLLTAKVGHRWEDVWPWLHHNKEDLVGWYPPILALTVMAVPVCFHAVCPILKEVLALALNKWTLNFYISGSAEIAGRYVLILLLCRWQLFPIYKVLELSMWFSLGTLWISVTSLGFSLTRERSGCVRVGVFSEPRISCSSSRTAAAQSLMCMCVYLLLLSWV